MKAFEKEHYEGMGKLNNELVDVIDSADLQPEEVLAVLEMMALRIKQLMMAVGNESGR
jgi:hypothetical protein